MPQVMPSEVVNTIDLLFPNYSTAGPSAPLGAGQSTQLRALVDLVKAIPDELLDMSSADYADLRVCLSAITELVDSWQARRGQGNTPTHRNDNLIAVIRSVLAKCPDEHRPKAHAELKFIPDAELRDSVRLDIGAAERALQNSEWKAATVLAGAAIEALLHWRLSQIPKPTVEAAARAPKRGGKTLDLDHWVLNDMILVAEDLAILSNSAATAALLTKDYRNLIHPGRAARLSQQCTRATAFSALGGMHATIEALS
jgi:hypothetical protein